MKAGVLHLWCKTLTGQRQGRRRRWIHNSLWAVLRGETAHDEFNIKYVYFICSDPSPPIIILNWRVNVLTDVVPSADFLQDVNLLDGRLPDLLDLLSSHLVRGSDVDDLHCVLLGGALVHAASHHAAHAPGSERTELFTTPLLHLFEMRTRQLSAPNVCLTGPFWLLFY